MTGIASRFSGYDASAVVTPAVAIPTLAAAPVVNTSVILRFTQDLRRSFAALRASSERGEGMTLDDLQRGDTGAAQRGTGP